MYIFQAYLLLYLEALGGIRHGLQNENPNIQKKLIWIVASLKLLGIRCPSLCKTSIE